MSELNISLFLYRWIHIPSSLRMKTVTLGLEVMILESVKLRVTLKSSSFSDRPSLFKVTSRHCIKFVFVMLATKGASGAMKSIPPPADQEQTRCQSFYFVAPKMSVFIASLYSYMYENEIWFCSPWASPATVSSVICNVLAPTIPLITSTQTDTLPSLSTTM